jgi:hypothetical protein
MLAAMAKGSTGNLRYLARLWAVALAFVGLSVLPFAFGDRSHADYTPLLIGVGVAVVMVVVLRMRIRRRIAREFLAPGPDGLIEHSKRVLGRARTPHARELLALGMASARAFYGQFGRARDELDEVSWDGMPDLYRASAMQIRALIHYLSRDDAAAGLAQAQQAAELGRLPRFTPGAKTSARVSATYIDVGRVLVEGASPELADTLDARLELASTPQERLLTLWGAAIARHGLGHTAQAQALFSQLKQLAPHCRPLHEEALHDEPAIAREREQSARGACARHPELAASARCVRCGNFMCDACTRQLSSQSAAVCADCHERYREQRESHLRAESRLRAAGMIAQTASVCSAGVLVLGGLWLASDPGLKALLMVWPGFALWTLLYWFAGGAMRRLEMSFRPQSLMLAMPLLGLIPFGTIGAVYLLWLALGPTGRVLQSLDHQRAISATPELTAKPSWAVVAVVLFVLAANLAAIIAVPFLAAS